MPWLWLVLVVTLLVGFAGPGTANALKPNLVEPSRESTANLAVSTDLNSGVIRARSGGTVLFKLKTAKGNVAARSLESAGLGGRRSIAFRQSKASYFSTWRHSFDGEFRGALLRIPGEGTFSVRVRAPRFNAAGGVITLLGGPRGRPPAGFESGGLSAFEDIPARFGNATLKLNDNGWVSFTAHLNAYGDHGSCDGSSGDSGFNCIAGGEPQNSHPFNGGSVFDSGQGGDLNFGLSGYDFYQWDQHTRLQNRADLDGHMNGGWASDKVYIRDSSRYFLDFPESWGKSCFRAPVSGTDDSLTGKPGGPLHANLTERGSFLSGGGYVLDLSGYLSEAPLVEGDCR